MRFKAVPRIASSSLCGNTRDFDLKEGTFLYGGDAPLVWGARDYLLDFSN